MVMDVTVTYSPPTLTGVGHQRTVSTSIGCNQWLSLAKTILKVALVGRNRSLVARTSKCGWAIIHAILLLMQPSISSFYHY